MDLISLAELARSVGLTPRRLRAQLRAFGAPGIIIERGERRKAYVDRDAMRLVDSNNAAVLAGRVKRIESRVDNHARRIENIEVHIGLEVGDDQEPAEDLQHSCP